MYALKNMMIYTGEEIIRDKCIIIEGKRNTKRYSRRD
jgi:hypothetical protein